MDIIFQVNVLQVSQKCKLDFSDEAENEFVRLSADWKQSKWIGEKTKANWHTVECVFPMSFGKTASCPHVSLVKSCCGIYWFDFTDFFFPPPLVLLQRAAF